MGRKSLAMAEKVLASVLSTVGPARFAIALGNATCHGGALHHCENVDLDMDDDDAMLNAWHAQIDRLRSVGLWLEEKEGRPDFLNVPDEQPSPYDTRELSELRVDDHTVQKIAVIEDLVFETIGRKIQILRKGSKKDTVVLRGSLSWFLDKLRAVAADDNDILDMFAFIARCIAEQRVKVCCELHEFACHDDYDRVKYRDLHHEIEEEDGVFFETTVLEFERFVQSITGCPVRIGAADRDEPSDDDVMRIEDVTRTFLKRVLENMVENDRSVIYMINYLRDTLGRDLASTCAGRYILTGDGMPVSSVAAKRRRSCRNSAALR
jgi:hypothetical protein